MKEQQPFIKVHCDTCDVCGGTILQLNMAHNDGDKGYKYPTCTCNKSETTHTPEPDEKDTSDDHTIHSSHILYTQESMLETLANLKKRRISRMNRCKRWLQKHLN